MPNKNPNTITIRGHVLDVPPGSKRFKVEPSWLLFLYPDRSTWLAIAREEPAQDDPWLPIIAAVAYAEWRLIARRSLGEKGPAFYNNANDEAYKWLVLLEELNS